MFKHLFDGGAGIGLYWLITVGALAGLFTTWNGFFTASANLLMAMGRAKMLPSWFAVQKNGVAINGLYIVALLSFVGPFLGYNMIDTVTCFSATAFIMSWMISALALLKLRKTMPNANRPYKLATPIAYWSAVAGIVYFIGALIPVCPWFAGSKAVIVFVIYIIVGFILFAATSGSRKALSPEEREKAMFGDLDLKAMRSK